MKKVLRQHEFYLFLVLLLASLAIGLINPVFFSLSNLYDLLKSGVVMGVFAIGVLLVLISGGIDISFTAIAAFSMYVTSKIVLHLQETDSILFSLLISSCRPSSLHWERQVSFADACSRSSEHRS